MNSYHHHLVTFSLSAFKHLLLVIYLLKCLLSMRLQVPDLKGDMRRFSLQQQDFMKGSGLQLNGADSPLTDNVLQRAFSRPSLYAICALTCPRIQRASHNFHEITFTETSISLFVMLKDRPSFFPGYMKVKAFFYCKKACC